MAGQEELTDDLEEGPTGRRIANQGHWKIEEEATNSPRRFIVVKTTRKAALGDGIGGDGGGARAWRGVVSRRGDCGSEAWDGEARLRAAGI